MLNFKEAAIESPSEQEKKHINDEEQGIDVPVVDNKCIKKHNKNCCKEANIMYDEMVKRAYEEILEDDLGYDYDYDYDEYDKEAGVKDIAGKALSGIKSAPGKAWSGIKSAPGKAWSGIKSYGRTVSGRNIKNIKNSWNNSQDLADMVISGKVKPGEGMKAMPDDLKKNLRSARLSRGAAIAIPVLAAAGATAYGIHRHNAAKSQAEQEAAEKAAAYYDEAQYVKEAAEADYAEACAYEDAAIQILDDLGYLD